MSLRSALRRLPADRGTEIAVREVLTLLRRHAGESFSVSGVVEAAHVSPVQAEEILGVFRKSFVLDSDGDPPSYTYRTDRLLELEIEGFMRRAERHSGLLQSNVEKFRRRQGL